LLGGELRTSLEELLTEELRSWPVGSAAVAVVDGSGVLASAGDQRTYQWASVTKLLTALVVLDAAWQERIDLDEPAGPPGSTVRHLLAHASGLSVDSDRTLSPPGQRRIYSNRGFDVLAEHLERRTGRPFPEQLQGRVLTPLGMDRTTLDGSPAKGCQGPVDDLARLATELLAPRHFPVDQLAKATTTAFGGLIGVLPGFGRQEPNDWGLGFEIHGRKSPHWMSSKNSPASFGHFGQAGAFCWVDPEAGLACVAAGDTPFGPWAADAWPKLSTRVLDVASGAAGQAGDGAGEEAS
jgi:CubicO group peptidase (beta-lactamase class C family)